MNLNLTHHDLEILGDPSSKEGALAVCKSVRGCLGLEIETRLRIGNSKYNSLREARLGFNEKLRKKEKELREEGVPNSLFQLFNFTSKNEVKKYCRQIEITEKCLSLLIFNCDQIGFSHESKFKKFVPEQVQYGREEIGLLGSKDTSAKVRKKIMNKVDGTFNFRRNVNCHMFTNGPMWHCFFFSYEDSQDLPNKEPHWKHGTHIHYVSYIWDNDKCKLWEKLNHRKISVTDFHIKFDSSQNNPLYQVLLYGRAVVQISKK
ncbi:MAG: hypothetical protein CME60_11580 [Halobacteriovoraceae bacterium]|nr:hypothetical protein [Halobacteriovoraceae bacterium]